jgi:hypothetical protein
VILRGLVGSVLVLAGGWVVATLPPSTPMLRHHLLVTLRGTESGRMAALAVILVGLGLVGHAWLSLGRRVSAAGRDDAESLDLVRYAAFIWSAPLLVAPPLFSRDGWSYAAQGALAAAGVSPYQHGPWLLSGPVHEAVDPRWWYTPTPYGPLPVWFGAEMAQHTGNPLMLAYAHRFLAMVGLVLLAWAVPRLARWCGTDPALSTLIVIASPLMLANGVGGLHNDLLMVGLMAAALVVAAEHGWVAGAAVGGLAAAVKLPGGLVCLGIVLLTLPVAAPLSRRLVRAVLVGAVALGVVFGLGWASGLGHGWLSALGVPGSVNTPLSVMTLLGGLLDDGAHLVGADTPPAYFLDLARTGGQLVAVVAVALVALRWPTGDRRRAISAVALTVGVLVLLSPVVHLWYLLWPLPFVAVLPLRRVGLLALLATSVIVGLVAPLDPSLHGAYVVIVMACVIIALLLAGLLLTRPARLRLERIAGRAHWPDVVAPAPAYELLEAYRPARRGAI